MKLKLHPYSKKSPALYKKEEKNIKGTFQDLGDYKIYHIGSTSVRGLGGKGIIDIMIAIKDWARKADYIKRLKRIGFKHIHPEEKGRFFLSRIRKTKKGDTHIHLVKSGSSELKQHLKFRNLLRRNKKEAKKYWQIKTTLHKKTKGERKDFGKLKERYIKKVLRKLS